MIIERWNQSLFGDVANPNLWVDRGFFILGAQAIDKLLDMLDSIPTSVLIGKLCPKGSEAQVFAILAALVNFGGNVAYITGSIVAQLYGVSFKNNGGDWTCTNPQGPLGISNLGWLRITATFILPGLTIPFTFCLLPDIGLNDDFLNEEGQEETELQSELQAGESFQAAPAPGRGQSTVSYKSADMAMWTNVSKRSLLSGPKGDLLF